MSIRYFNFAVALALLLGGTALAQETSMEDLRLAPASRQVTSVVYCAGQYTIGFADGSVRKFGERDLRFATDSSPFGPPVGRVVLIPTGRVGDRAIVVFVGPGDIAAAVRVRC
jgi:hypothetical protein